MKLSVSSPTHRDFVLFPVPPEQYPEEMMPGSEMSYAEGSFGKVVIQEVSAEPFSLLYSFYDIQEKCVLQFQGEAPPLRLLVALKGQGHFITNGPGELHLQQGQFNILYTPKIDSTVIFGRASESLLFNLHMPVQMLEELAPMFPLQGFIDKTRFSEAAMLFPTPGWISSEILREITYLLQFPADPILRGHLFGLKVRQLLHLLLLQKFYTGKEPIEVGMLESIQEARHIIEASVGEHLTIGKVAAQAGISEYDLRKYFAQVVGQGLSTFITHARLNNAKLLIQETDLPIKEIARIAGYDHEQNFIHAFKKCFDYTPYFIRKLG